MQQICITATVNGFHLVGSCNQSTSILSSDCNSPLALVPFAVAANVDGVEGRLSLLIFELLAIGVMFMSSLNRLLLLRSLLGLSILPSALLSRVSSGDSVLYG